MKKLVAILLLPFVVILIIAQSSWDALKLFCATVASEFSNEYESYAELFSSSKDKVKDEEETDWWNFS
jgi:hypothetical protein